MCGLQSMAYLAVRGQHPPICSGRNACTHVRAPIRIVRHGMSGRNWDSSRSRDAILIGWRPDLKALVLSIYPPGGTYQQTLLTNIGKDTMSGTCRGWVAPLGEPIATARLLAQSTC